MLMMTMMVMLVIMADLIVIVLMVMNDHQWITLALVIMADQPHH